MKIEDAKAQLHPFLESHPDVGIEYREVGRKSETQLCITKPWGEDGLVISLPEDIETFSETLNSILLPERYTAIWHKDTKDFEIIWTALLLSEEIEDIKNREFLFSLDSKEYKCSFGRSSERLLTLASQTIPIAMSHTEHRNLMSFRYYVEQKESKKSSTSSVVPIGEPYSFWIRNVEWDEDRVLQLVRHLNFFLTYYDRESPHILVHTPPDKKASKQPRYLTGAFPNHIDTHAIADDLLQLWIASREGDAARRFIYSYRIIEYASHAYLDIEARRKVHRLLAEPHAQSDLGALTNKVVSTALMKTMDDVQKMSNLLNDIVSTESLWREVERHRSTFTNNVIFDGGFTLKELIDDSATLETFKTNGILTFLNRARSIRNHLSHGRDKSTQATITPTIANFRQLEPWTAAISVLAGEILILSDLLTIN